MKLIVNKNTSITKGEAPNNVLPSDLDTSVWVLEEYNPQDIDDPICPPPYNISDDDTGVKFIDGQIVWP
jgi:hypothetical protein